MISRYLINVSLILLIAGLYWLNTSKTVTDNNISPLTAIASDTINKITISRSASPDITLKKTASDWQLTAPLHAPANTTRIELLLSLLTTHSYAQSSQQNQHLAKFGLAPSSISLQLNDELFQFGDIEQVSEHRYVLYNNIIHLINDKITPLLSANAASFIENRLLAKKKSISKIVLPLRSTDGDFSDNNISIKNNNGHWKSEQATLTADRLTALIDNWQHSYALQVTPIHEKTKENADLYHPIIIWFEDGTKTDLTVSLSANVLYIIDPKQQLKYHFTPTKAQQLFPLDKIAP